MRTTDNKKFGPTSASDDDVKRDAGLSSAMHDMRLLAERYRDDRDAAEARDHVPVLGGAIDPRVLLMPVAEPRTDRYRIAMLAMMILVGLSTSAIAVRMALQTAPRQEVSVPAIKPIAPAVTRPVHETSNELPIHAEPSDGDSKAYKLKSTPARTQTHRKFRDQVVPSASKTKRKRLKSAKLSSLDAQSKIDSSATCDEVACLLGDSDACCGTVPGQDTDSISKAEQLEGRPYRLTRLQVMDPMQSVRGRVRGCADQSDFQGIATVKIVIAADGRVSNFELDDGGGEFQSCVEKHVSGLRFPLLRQPFTVSYPYTLR